jgi:uncharacterized NAD-dependent epimerase/dehydratase family protein
MKRVIIHHYDQNGHAVVRFARGFKILAVYDERPDLEGRDAGRFIGAEEKGITISRNFDSVLKEQCKDADMLITTGEGLYFTNKKNVSDWTNNIKKAIGAGLDIYNMSKIYYGPGTRELRELASKSGVEFTEASDPDGWKPFLPYALKAREEGIKVPRVIFNGSSMNSGKITAMLIMRDHLEKEGKKVGVVGTEPCSIFVGADEQVIPEVLPTMKGAPAIYGAIKKVDSEKKPDLILVGGQTGLRSSVLDVRESRAGAVVAWQILLGSEPSKIVLCTKWSNTQEIGPHLELIKNSTLKAPVVANVINGFGCDKNKLREVISSTQEKFGLPCLDVIANTERIKELADLILK